LANLARTGTVHHACYDKLLFNRFKALLGGRVRKIITGSAPLSAEVQNFLKICFSCAMQEAYGMTETAGWAALSDPRDPLSGHVGGLNAGVKIRLRDAPEMGYLHTNKPP